MKLGFASWLLTIALLGFSSYGIYHATSLECHNYRIQPWLIVLYSIIIANRVLYVGLVEGYEIVVNQATFIACMFSAFIILGIFTCIWTIVGTRWVIKELLADDSCISGIDFWTSIFFLVTIYTLFLAFFVLVLYACYAVSKNDDLIKAFKAELNQIYVDQEHVCALDVNKFISKYRALLNAEPIMDIENYILMQYCSKRVKHDDQEEECDVCLVAFEPGDLKTSIDCRHIFHYDCVLGWYKLKSHCPYCRQPFREGLIKAYYANVTERKHAEQNENV